MADSAIVLYLRFLVGLISYFEKLGQRDLIKKNCKNLQKMYFNLLINHQADFNEI